MSCRVRREKSRRVSVSAREQRAPPEIRLFSAELVDPLEELGDHGCELVPVGIVPEPMVESLELIEGADGELEAREEFGSRVLHRVVCRV